MTFKRYFYQPAIQGRTVVARGSTVPLCFCGSRFLYRWKRDKRLRCGRGHFA